MSRTNGNPRPHVEKWGPCIVMVSDRSPLNYQRLADTVIHSDAAVDPFWRNFPFQVGGVITPGGEFTAQETVETRMRLRERYLNVPSLTMPYVRNVPGTDFDEHIGSVQYVFNDGYQFRHVVLPYDMAAIKRDENERRRYSEELVDEIRRLDPDLVILDNFKLILDRIVAEEFKGRILNVHPSVLPLFKGWRTEKAAYMAGRSDALGYTFHEVVPELDRGPTIFSTPVDFSDIDAQFDGSLTDSILEETLRLRIIAHESEHIARILAIYASGVARKVVSGLEAFTAEGRPEFFYSDEYQELVRQEKENAQTEDVEFVEYSRMLFDVMSNGTYDTLESVIGVEKSGMFEHINAGLRTYRFNIKDLQAAAKLTDVARDRGIFCSMKIDNTDPTRGAAVEITCGSELGDVIGGLGLDHKVTTHSSLVTAPRKHPERILIGP